jgi:hypothetical protein
MGLGLVFRVFGSVLLNFIDGEQHQSGGTFESNISVQSFCERNASLMEPLHSPANLHVSDTLSLQLVWKKLSEENCCCIFEAMQSSVIFELFPTVLIKHTASLDFLILL